MTAMRDLRKSNFFPHKPVLTERNLPDQNGKVFIVTGGTGALGKELIDILYQHNAKIYVAARSGTKSQEVIQELEAKHPKSRGKLIFLKLVLDDLSTIKGSANEFLGKEDRLDVLWNNAGVMIPPEGSRTVQDFELQLGTNNLGHHLFTRFLTPMLVKTAASSNTVSPYSVRVVWVSSSAADFAPHPALDFSRMNGEPGENIWKPYARSKAGNMIQAAEFARRYGSAGVLSLALNPGNFVTNLQQNMPALQLAMFKLISHEPRRGAYTELFAGLGTSLNEKDNGGFVAPFGKLEAPRKDLIEPELGRKYWEWCESQVAQFV